MKWNTDRATTGIAGWSSKRPERDCRWDGDSSTTSRVVEVLRDARRAMERYLTLHRHAPQRELYVVHSRRKLLVIEERHWSGLRPLPRTVEL